jgi:myo-inositol-1(or 4)-monophosphatase
MSFLDTAIEAAKISSAILIDNLQRESKKAISHKMEFDFVTQVDHMSENAIIKFIKSRHSDHEILAEESGGVRHHDGYLWIIDPLDGTKNYIHSIPIFTVSIALMHQGEIITAVVNDPSRDELFRAERGKGAFLNDKPITVSENKDMAQCLLATGFPFKNKHQTDLYLQAFAALFDQISDMRRTGSAALDLSYIACGRLDGFWEMILNPWDIAAGALLIEEAGGQLTDIWGEDDYLYNGHLIASNGHIQQQIVATLQNIFKKNHF